MVDYSPVSSLVIIFSFLLIVYFLLLNMVFVVLLDSFETVKNNFTMTLLKYSILWNGLKQFFNNWILKIATILKIKRLIYGKKYG